MTSNEQTGPMSIGPFERFSDAWLECMKHIMKSGQDITDDGAGLREITNVSITARTCRVQDFHQAGADESRMALMERKYHSIDIVPPYTLSYGAMFRAHEGVDQIAWLVSRLRGKRETKSATIGFHVPGSDDLSCISLYDCKIRRGLLNVTAVYRSQNVFGSQPGNVVALAVFQEEIARHLQVESGPLTIHALSAHIYKNDFDAVQRILDSR